MFWRSVVGKLAITILLLVSFVLFILSILLLEFFEGFHVQEAEKAMQQNAEKISLIFEEHDEKSIIVEMMDRVKDPTSRIMIYFNNGDTWLSNTTNKYLENLDAISPDQNEQLRTDITKGEPFNDQIQISEDKKSEIMVIGQPMENGDGTILVFQSLDVINQTKAETTKIIFVAAAIAIVLTTIFAFFLSTRITAPLIQMRKVAFDITKGEFNTKVPVLTNDEIGELAIAFNRMGKQLHFHINALRQEKEQLSSIVNSMADGVVTLTREGQIIVINPPAEQFIEGWFFENNLDYTDGKQLPDDLNSILQKVVADEKEVLQELNLQGRNWVMIMTPLYDNTYVRGAVAVIRDMTEERQLDKLRKDFISNVSHELRTPISLMQGYSEAIVDDIAASTAEKNELAQIILDESLRMGRLVNELLDISRMEAGHIELNLESIDINIFLDRIYRKFSKMADESEIEFRLTKEIERNMIIVDPDRLEQVFTNLIDNAMTHTGKLGFVSVFVRATVEQISIEIEDNGSGIPEEDLSFIFERFYKADKSRTRNKKKKGTGLGLAIVKHLVTAHDGTISVKSKVNKGTIFSIKIPQNSGL